MRAFLRGVQPCLEFFERAGEPLEVLGPLEADVAGRPVRARTTPPGASPRREVRGEEAGQFVGRVSTYPSVPFTRIGTLLSVTMGTFRHCCPRVSEAWRVEVRCV